MSVDRRSILTGGALLALAAAAPAEAKAAPASHHLKNVAVCARLLPRNAYANGKPFAAGVTFLPYGKHYAVTGH